MNPKIDIEPKHYIPRQLIKTKIKKSRYNKEDIEKVFELLDQNIELDDIVNQSNFTKRQIKHIRFIKLNASEQELELLFDCQYYLSSIRKYINKRKTIRKRRSKIEQRLNKK